VAPGGKKGYVSKDGGRRVIRERTLKGKFSWKRTKMTITWIEVRAPETGNKFFFRGERGGFLRRKPCDMQRLKFYGGQKENEKIE